MLRELKNFIALMTAIARCCLKMAAVCILVTSFRASSQTRSVAVTFDDLPYVAGSDFHELTSADGAKAVESNKKLLNALQKNHVPATGFVIGQGVSRLGGDAGTLVLRLWAERGFGLGNHSFSHLNYNRVSGPQIGADILANEPTFARAAAGRQNPQKFFRFPFNHTGNTPEKHSAIMSFLDSHGYTLAPCTIEDYDWLFNAAYRDANVRNDFAAKKRVEREYIAFLQRSIGFYAALNIHVLGHEPPEILLLHDNPLNADLAEEIIALFMKEGYRFVSLSQALKDPAYRISDTFVGDRGVMWGFRWAQERHIPISGTEPTPPAWIMSYELRSNAPR